MAVRRLDRDEYPDAVNLAREVFFSQGNLGFSREGARSFLEYVSAHGDLLEYYGAYEGDLKGIIGFDDTYHISLFFVRSENQKQGIGRELLQALTAEAAENGAARITVNAAESAVPVYEALGFEQEGELREEDGIRYVPMELFLCSGILGRTVTVFVDRPCGSFHPYYGDVQYTANYGYISTMTDGAFQDAYVYGPGEPVEVFKGTVIAVLYRKNSHQSVWIVSSGSDYERQDVLDAVGSTEQFEDTRIIWDH